MGIEVRSCSVKPSLAVPGQLEASLDFSIHGKPHMVSLNGTNNQYILAERLYRAIRAHTEVAHNVDRVHVDSSGASVTLSTPNQDSFQFRAEGSNPAESAVLAYIGALDELMHYGV